jgi:F-type H+-transporting ATPase subunit gamma
MASAKELKKKIRSISNTRKITRTMELVATVKAKRTQDKVIASTPYATALSGLLGDLARAGTVEHPLLRAPEGVLPTAIFVISANRGLCGGYNTNVLALAESVLAGEKSAGRHAEISMAGKKGIARLRFLGMAAKETFTNLDDKARFADSAAVAEELMDRFLAGEVGKVLVVSTRYLSSSSQRPEVSQILPIVPSGAGPGAAGKAAPAADRGPAEGVSYIFEPDPRRILEILLPMSVKAIFHRLVLESAASEQVARRLAMKLATDNAEEMIRFYNRFYNRTRQAGITQQINEIVSGANALE